MKKLLSILIIAAFLIFPSAICSIEATGVELSGIDTRFAQEQDYTIYTEVDVGADRVSVETNKITVTDLDDDEVVYVYKDFGLNYFSGNPTFELDFKCTDGAAICGLWGLSQDIGTLRWHMDDNKNFLFVAQEAADKLLLYSRHGGNWELGYSSALAVDGTNHYLTITINRTSATLTCGIYSDAGRQTLVESVAIDLSDATDEYQYLYPMQGNGLIGAGGVTWDGEIKNLVMIK